MSLPDQPRVLVVIPAFNEAGSIADVVRAVHEAMPEADVLVVDDGSTDSTAASVPAPATCVSLPFNLGIGGAMQTGYRYAALHGYDVAIQVDADGQHPPDQAPLLVAALRETQADLVVGSRFIGEASYRPPAARMMAIRLLRGLIHFLTGGHGVSDPTSGMRAAGPAAIRAFAHWYPDDYPEPEVVLLLRRAGYAVAEAAVRMAPRAAGVTSISFLQGLFYVLKVSAALLLDLFRDPWPREKLR